MNLAAEAYSALLYALTIGLEAKLVYEIGVRRGYSTRAILRGLVETNGRLISCDIEDCRAAVACADLRARWSFWKVDSRQFPDMLKRQADMVYIDGNHEYADVLADVVGMWPKLKVDGLMVLHDTDLDGPGEVLRKLQAEGREVVELPFARRFGIVRKRRDERL